MLFQVTRVLTVAASARDGFLSYRLGCPDGRLATPVGDSIPFTDLLMYQGQVQPLDVDWFRSLFGAFFDLSQPVRPLRFAPPENETFFSGCDRPSFIELFSFSTDGLDLRGLTVVINDVEEYTFRPETAWPELYAPLNTRDAIYLDLDDSFSSPYRNADPAVRVALSQACHIDLVGSFVFYKLLDTRGRPLAPARGPPFNEGQAWNPPRVLDDAPVFAGVSTVDWLPRNNTLWDCGGPFNDVPIDLGGIEVVYNTSSSIGKLVASIQGTTYVADVATAYRPSSEDNLLPPSSSSSYVRFSF